MTVALFCQLMEPLNDPTLGHQGYAQGVVVTTDRPYYYLVGGLFTSGGAVQWFIHENGHSFGCSHGVDQSPWSKRSGDHRANEVIVPTS